MIAAPSLQRPLQLDGFRPPGETPQRRKKFSWFFWPASFRSIVRRRFGEIGSAYNEARASPSHRSQLSHSGPNWFSNSWRSLCAKAPLCPAVEMAICSGPRRTTAGQKKSQYARSCTTLHNTSRFCASSKTDRFTAFDEVATMTRKISSRSFGSNRLCAQKSCSSRAQVWTFDVALGATTATVAPPARSVEIFSSADLPAPTTRHRRPMSLRKIGKSLVFSPAWSDDILRIRV